MRLNYNDFINELEPGGLYRRMGPPLEVKQRSKPLSEVNSGRPGREGEYKEGDWIQMVDGYAEEKHKR